MVATASVLAASILCIVGLDVLACREPWMYCSAEREVSVASRLGSRATSAPEAPHPTSSHMHVPRPSA